MSDNPWASCDLPTIRPVRSRLLLVAALVLHISVGLLLCRWSLPWLWSVLAETDLLGRSIPPKGFTWDRFGSPLLASLASIAVLTTGIAGWIACDKR